MKEVWQIDAYNRSAEQAADEFAATHWDRERKRTKIKNGRFKMRDGIFEYQVRLDQSTRPARYVIEQF